MKLLCDRCIRAIESRGETIQLGAQVSRDDIYDEDDNAEFECEWCGEEYDELREVEFYKSKNTPAKKAIKSTFDNVSAAFKKNTQRPASNSKSPVTEFARKAHYRTGKDGHKYKVRGTIVHKT